MALTAGQERNERSRIERGRFLAEYYRIAKTGKRPDVPALAEKYKRTPQCLYQWLKWGRAQATKAKGGVA